ncbi:MAG: hypothetical protein HY566_02245, partial [Candidatus Kerfeldbacteria bacterium]|nr:hypothetical protein [Candidatus Kerfeldbacteria bacterium]
ELWKNQRGRFFLVWLVAGIFVSQIPAFPYAYRVMIIMHLPLAYAASMGMLWLWGRFRSRLRVQVLLVFLAVAAFSDNISHLTHNFRRDYRASQKLYLTSEASQAILWLRKETPTNSVLLHSPSWDTLLAEQAYRQVFATAGWQTVDSTRNIFSALNVYSGKESAQELEDFLRASRITHIIVSPLERQSGVWRIFPTPSSDISAEYVFGFSPSQYSFLREVYNEGGFEIYAFSPQGTGTTPE